MQIELKWDEKRFLEGAKLAYDYDMRQTWRRYVGWLFIAMTQFGVVGAIRHGSVGLLLISTLLVLYWYFLRWPLRKRVLRRFFKRSAVAGKRLRLMLEEKGLCVDDQCIPWDRFTRVIATETGYLLDMGDGFFYLPRSIFASAKMRNDFVATLKERVVWIDVRKEK